MTKKRTWKRKNREKKPCLVRTWRAVRSFFLSPSDKYPFAKRVLGFPMGLLLAVGFYYACIDRLKFVEFVRYAIGGAIGLSLSVGFAMSPQVRCISMLVFPYMCSKAGRGYVGTYTLALLLGGPIANLVLNGKEIVRSFTCTTKMLINQTKASLELKLKPFKDVMMDFQGEANSIHNLTHKIKQDFQPMLSEIMDLGPIKKLRGEVDYVDEIGEGQQESRSQMIEKKYKSRGDQSKSKKFENLYEKKLDYRCEEVFSAGVVGCRRMFTNLEEKCMQKLWIAGHLLCLPLKLSVLCQLVRFMPGVASSCNSQDAVNQGFGEEFEVAKAAAEEFDEGFKVNMQYKVDLGEEALDRLTVDDVTKATQHEFESRVVWVDFFIALVQRCLGFLFLRVVLKSTQYHTGYLDSFQQDNNYIDSYFRRIDARRHKQGKRTLLPLKKSEKKKAVFPWSPSLRGPEVKAIRSGTLKIVARGATYGMIVFIDFLVYHALDIIRTHSRIEMRQHGEHHIRLIVYGNGMLGRLVKKLLRRFNQKHSIDNITTNFDCLPNPTKTSLESILMMYGTLVIQWLLLILDGYSLRLRRVVASFFYPKREKKRVLFFYNSMLKKRKGFLKHMRHDIKRRAKERRISKETSIMMGLRFSFPRLCGWITAIGLGKKKCLICEETENKTFKHCPTRGCNFGYCRECWIDIKKSCYACMPEQEWDSEDSGFTDYDG